MKKTNIIRKVIAGVLAAVMCLALAACGSEAAAPAADTAADSQAKTTYTIGLCNYVDDASLNQIVDNIQTRLAEMAKRRAWSSMFSTITAMPTQALWSRSFPTTSPIR